MKSFFSFPKNGKLFLTIKIILLISFVFIVQLIFLSEASKRGFNLWDDWGMLFYYDAHKAYDIQNFPFILRDTGTPYIWTEIYNIGFLKDLFGLNQTRLKLVEIFLKSLAALSVGYLVFKFTKNKLFFILTIYIYTVSTTTAGLLPHIIFAGGYLSVFFICLFILFYFNSFKKPKYIYLSSLFLFFALLVCPPRAYPVILIPFVVELSIYKKKLILNSINRLLIFCLPLFLLKSRAGFFIPHLEAFSHVRQFFSGNFYTITYPFQSFSAHFIDYKYFLDLLNFSEKYLPFLNADFRGFIVINIIIIATTIFFTYLLQVKKPYKLSFQILGWTLILEIFFYVLGVLSVKDGVITYVNYTVHDYSKFPLNPTVFQASLGGFIFLCGLLLCWRWWKYQRNNMVMAVTSLAWGWSFFLNLFLYLTTHWYSTISQSSDRYILVSSMGSTVFIAGIFYLSFQAALSRKKIFLKTLLVSCLVIILSMITLKNYKILKDYDYDVNEIQGNSAFWQDTMYNRFLSKFGSENLRKKALIYIDSGNLAFNSGSLTLPLRYRIYYGEDNEIIRSNCKMVVSDLNLLKKSYVTHQGVKGFIFHTSCVEPDVHYTDYDIFYSFNDFFAYKIENKQLIDIKEETINKLEN